MAHFRDNIASRWSWPLMTSGDLNTDLSKNLLKLFLMNSYELPNVFLFLATTSGSRDRREASPSPSHQVVGNPESHQGAAQPAPRWSIHGPCSLLGGGGGPPAICQTTGPILDPKPTFSSPGMSLSEYIHKRYLKITVDATSQVKDKIFEHLSWLASPLTVAISYWNKAVETWWIVSGMFLSTHLSLWDLLKSQSYLRPRGQRRSKCKF